MIYIKVPSINDSYSRISISGIVYFIRFTYNDTFGYWAFGVYDVNKNPIVAGMKIVPNYPVSLYYRAHGLPDGYFLAQTQKDAIGRYDFDNGNAVFTFVPLG